MLADTIPTLQGEEEAGEEEEGEEGEEEREGVITTLQGEESVEESEVVDVTTLLGEEPRKLPGKAKELMTMARMFCPVITSDDAY